MEEKINWEDEGGGCRTPPRAAQKIKNRNSFVICFSLWLFKDSMRRFYILFVFEKVSTRKLFTYYRISRSNFRKVSRVVEKYCHTTGMFYPRRT